MVPAFKPVRAARLTAVVILATLTLGPPAAGGSDTPPMPRVPDGFTIERVVAPDTVRFPMFAAFDDRGRLYVTESSGLDLYKELTDLTRKCRVSLLTDTDGDGTFDASTVFQDRLVMPMGALWRDGKLYVPDGEDLITLEDTDGDGKADRRAVHLHGFGHSDNGGLHGVTFGPDGWLYMTCGQPDGFRLKRADGSWLEGKSGALLRCRPDGSDPQVLSRGFENLVEAVFFPTGEVVGTVNWYQKPEGGIRDALVHLAHGGQYPYVPDVGSPQPVTGPVLPAVTKFPAVALSGLMVAQGKALGPAFQGNLFSAQHNTRKVGRHVFTRGGSTFHSSDFDFVTSDDPDFHPSDVLEDADGSLIVVDTGSWYIHHCPTGQIRHSPATGGVYRVRRKGAKAPPDPWGLKTDWDGAKPADLTKLLADPRPAVRQKAQQTLVARGSLAIPALAGTLQMATDTATAQRALWTLAQVPDESAAAMLRAALGEHKPDLVATAARALGSRADGASAALLAPLLKAGAPHVRAAAAEALAYCGRAESLPALWDALAASPPPDRMLEHAIVFAIHRACDAESLAAALLNPSPRVQAAAMLLLDQPPRPAGALAPEAAFERLASRDEGLRSAALQRVERHPEWAGRATEVIRESLKGSASPEQEQRLHRLVSAFESDRAVQELVAEALGDDARLGPDARVRLLGVLAHSRLATPPESWVALLDRLMDDPAAAVRDQAVRTAAALQPRRLDDRMAAVAADAGRPVGVRMEALRSVVGRRPKLEAGTFDLLLSRLAPAAAPSERLAAAALVGRARIDAAQARAVLAAVKDDALVSVGTILPPIADAARGSPELAVELVSYLEVSAGRGWEPSPEQLEATLAGMPAAARDGADALRAKLRGSADGRRARLASYEPLLAGGDTVRGRAVFYGNKVACAACHRVGAEGGQVGPDLTKVGAVRAGRDILESIVLPSSTFAQGYDNYVVQATDGEVYGGIIPQPDADVIDIRDGAGKSTRLRKDQVRRLRRQSVSVMPDGLPNALTPVEFQDLLAFLQGLK